MTLLIDLDFLLLSLFLDTDYISPLVIYLLGICGFFFEKKSIKGRPPIKRYFRLQIMQERKVINELKT